MERHESRDLDAVIDGVARAMTSRRLERDLRSALAARLVAAPPWAIGWRTAVAVAAMAVLAVTMAVVSRSGGEPQPTRSAARPGDQRAVASGQELPAVPGLTTAVDVRAERTEPTERRASRPAIRVARQTIVRPTGTEDIVVIRPVSIVPLAGNDATTAAPQAPQAVTIAPIDVEPVRITELGEQVE
jgi:hypothetical protein